MQGKYQDKVVRLLKKQQDLMADLILENWRSVSSENGVLILDL